jgi:hypothetical protein
MAFKLPRLPRSLAIANRDGTPSTDFRVWWDSVATKSEAQETSQDDLLAQIQAVQADILAAQADIIAAQAAADAAATAAAAAQADADAVEATVAGLVIPPTGSRPVTADDTITDADATILADATAGVITLTLPPALTSPGPFTVKKIDASANAVNVDGDGSDQINGSGVALAITTQYESRTFVSDGSSQWFA